VSQSTLCGVSLEPIIAKKEPSIAKMQDGSITKGCHRPQANELNMLLAVEPSTSLVCAAMSPRVAILLSFVACSAACSSGSDTVLVFNFSADPNVTNVTRIDVTATRSNGSPFKGSFTAQSPDGGPLVTFYERVTLAGWEGHVHAEAQGITADQSPSGTATRDVDVEKNTTVAVFLNLTLPSAGDGGVADGAAADAGDAPAAAADATESGGADARAAADGAGVE
jgi:hypothetical protein